MGKVLAFPSARFAKRGSYAGHDSAHGHQVGSTATGNVVVSTFNHDAHRQGDWSNQEIADLYRVESLLIQASISITSARGLAEDGAPWFVFLRDDGEVFVHLARIDGRYILDSPGLPEILEGSDFAELIRKFVSSVAAKGTPATGNVISLRPRMLHDQTIRLHPAVMLGALIWSLYVASDDFVGMAHAMEEAEGRTDPFSALDASTSALVLSPELAVSQLDAALDEQAHSYGAGEFSAPTTTDSAKAGVSSDARGGATSTSGTVAWAQSLAASLAAIAIGYGFVHISDVPETTEAGWDFLALANVSETDGGVQYVEGEGTPTDAYDGASSVASDGLVADVAQHLQNSDLKVDVPFLLDGLAAEAHLAGQQADIADEANSDAKVADDAAPVKMAKGASKGADAQPAAAPTPDPAPAAQTAAVEVARASESQILLAMVDGFVGGLAEHKYGDLMVSTSLDQRELEVLLGRFQDGQKDGDAASGSVIDDPETPVAAVVEPVRPVGNQISYLEYDDRAKDFVAKFIERAGKIELVQFDSHIVLVDMTAIDEATDVTYTLRWVTEDGSVISTIGHLQYFLDYGIA